MGARGPAPTPTAVLNARGSKQRYKRGPEPEITLGAPRCPQWLSTDARKEWRRITPRLGGAGVLSEVDGAALARYCEMLVQWRGCLAFVQEHGDTYEAASETKEWPQSKRLSRLHDQLLRTEQQFGLTPSARARLAKPPEKETPKGKERFFVPKLTG